MRAIKHNTHQEVHDAVKHAAEMIDALDLDEDLRVAAFTFAAQQLIGKQIFYHPADQAPLVEPAMAIPGKRH